MICKVNFTIILLPQESKASTFFLNFKSGPEDGDQGHGLLQGQGLLLRHQGPKRVRHTPFLAKEIKVSTFFPKLKSGLIDGGQGHGLLLQLQGPKRVRPAPFLAEEIKVSTCFTKLESGLVDGDQGHGLLLRHQGPKRVCHEQLHGTYLFLNIYSFSDPSGELKIVMGRTNSLGIFDPG